MLKRNIYRTVLENQTLQRSLSSNSEKVDVINLPDPITIKNNYGARRDPIDSLTDFKITIHETDGLEHGYREGSEWYNNLTLTKFICLESNTQRTIWKSVSQPHSVVKTLFLPFKWDNDVVLDAQGHLVSQYQYIYLEPKIEIGVILDIYIKDYTRIVEGWMVDKGRVYFSVDNTTISFIGKEACITLSVAGTISV